MSKIIKQLHPDVIRKTAKRCRKRGIVLPTFASNCATRTSSRQPSSESSKASACGT